MNMKKVFLLAICLLGLTQLFAQETFSVVALSDTTYTLQFTQKLQNGRQNVYFDESEYKAIEVIRRAYELVEERETDAAEGWANYFQDRLTAKTMLDSVNVFNDTITNVTYYALMQSKHTKEWPTENGKTNGILRLGGSQLRGFFFTDQQGRLKFEVVQANGELFSPRDNGFILTRSAKSFRLTPLAATNEALEFNLVRDSPKVAVYKALRRNGGLATILRFKK